MPQAIEWKKNIVPSFLLPTDYFSENFIGGQIWDSQYYIWYQIAQTSVSSHDGLRVEQVQLETVTTWHCSKRSIVAKSIYSSVLTIKSSQINSKFQILQQHFKTSVEGLSSWHQIFIHLTPCGQLQQKQQSIKICVQHKHDSASYFRMAQIETTNITIIYAAYYKYLKISNRSLITWNKIDSRCTIWRNQSREQW